MGLYRLLPGWGPITRFDAREGDETLRINQFLIKDHFEKGKSHSAGKEQHIGPYGTIGAPTWGKLESPSTRRVPFFHPVYGECKLVEGFQETQHLRAESSWWAKDEPHFMNAKGLYETMTIALDRRLQ